MAENELCSLHNKTKGTLPRVPFVSIKNEILGISYELSIAFLSASAQKKLNTKYRQKIQTTNILSFPLSENAGQITFDLVKVKKDAKLFDMTYTRFVKFLFIHGCLHLLGYEHSSTMEKEERKFMKKFSK